MDTNNSAFNWRLPPNTLDLQPHQVDVWCAHLNIPNDSLKSLETTLSADEAERAAHFHFPADRDRFIASHGFLRDVLARYLHCEPRQLIFSIGTYGKPALFANSSQKKIEFNLSHSRDYALVAVTWEHKVGIDVEWARQGISSQVIARQYFSKSEVAELVALPSEKWQAGFFNCWTRKEAYIKAQGQGLSLPLESFDVSLTPNEPAILRATRPDQEEAARWTLLSLEIDPRYSSAVAVDAKSVEFRLWDWN